MEAGKVCDSISHLIREFRLISTGKESCILWLSSYDQYTYLFNKTHGSLLIVTILHASQNAWANLLSDNTLRPFQFTVALLWMIAIALIFVTKGWLGYKPE